ncbi:MAG: CDP-glucose 4,6-dehydratase [Chloroflexi bacterium]|nr:CDP-glucose 4,6-dehydratase [Chloroflexota bacterium]
MKMEFWKDKKVLVTGHTGFKGGWLSLWLESLGAEVIGYALAPDTEPSLFDMAVVGKGMTSVYGDIRDLDNLKKEINKHKPDIVFHLAAQSLVRRSYADPVGTYETNVMGTINILESVRSADSVRVVVNVTSDKCYENREWVWGYRECDPMGGFDPYSSSKGCSELVTSAYRDSFFNPSNYDEHGVALASARAGNVIGGGDWATDRLVPDIIRAIIAGKPVVIRNPKAVRPWQFVLEALNGYLTLASRLWNDGPLYSGPWNFGPSDDDIVPVAEVTQMIVDLWGEGAEWVLDKNSNPHEAGLLKLDSSKAKYKLGWKPKLKLKDSMKCVVDWYSQYAKGGDMRRLTQKQIEEFQNMGGKDK